jgi:hypothetical protein
LRAQKRADGVTAKTRQMRQKMTAGPLKTFGAGKSWSTGADELL